MTAYHGGKKRIGRKIAQDIAKYSPKARVYVEPFCGMLGVFIHSLNFIDAEYYIAGDINGSLIEMWKEIQGGWKPPKRCSEKKFKKLKYNGETSAEKGFLGHALGFRGIYFNTKRFDVDLERAAAKISDYKSEIGDISFFEGSYDQFSNIRGGVIYCDPPYFIQSVYMDEFGSRRTFNFKEFYEWAEMMAKNNFVFISERVDVLPISAELIAAYPNDEKLFLVVKS